VSALASAWTMRIGASISVLGGLLIAAGAIVATGSARTDGPVAQFSLQTNDRFEVAGSSVACRVIPKAPYSNRLICFVETKPQSYTPRPGTYAIELAEGNVAVGRAGGKQPLFVRAEQPPSGAPAGSDQARRAIAGSSIRLANRDDRAFVAGTHIVCRPWNKSPRSVVCVSMGSDGRVHDGTYMAWLSAHGVVLAQVRNRTSVTVFQRVNGQ
jgi:hypothetical protein